MKGEKEVLEVKSGVPVHWYSCGPTVYDHAHLGHARTYVTFDILQRILQDVFSIPVVHVLGITDVDDKIVKRAAEQQVEWVQLARTFERSFFTDLLALNVSPPTTITRVSEYIPDIISYISAILDRDLAYVSNGSVYFDSEEYQRRGGRRAFTILEEHHESEESSSVAVQEKKRASDFALWKKCANDNEPGWVSHWSRGRPGWHIECSVMSQKVFGDQLDIHVGGIDLRFPHHENEITQCRAYAGNCSLVWPRYFLHTGHLHIAGMKMSKSLKNFITIQELLKDFTGNQFRLFCLSNRYHSNVNYSVDRMHESAAVERRFGEFFLNTRHIVERAKGGQYLWRNGEREMAEKWKKSMIKVNESLADNFDTPSAMQELNTLVTQANSYVKANSEPSKYLLLNIAHYIRKMLVTFGLEESQEKHNSLPTHDALDMFAAFRSKIRKNALGTIPADERIKAILKECDIARNQTFPKVLHHKLEDQPDHSYVLKPLSPPKSIEKK